MRRADFAGPRRSSSWPDRGASATSHAKGELYFSERTKTDHGRRRIDLDPATLAVLKSRQRRQKEQRLLLGAGWTDRRSRVHRAGRPAARPRVGRQGVRAPRRRRVGLPRGRTFTTCALQQIRRPDRGREKQAPDRPAAWSRLELIHNGHRWPPVRGHQRRVRRPPQPSLPWSMGPGSPRTLRFIACISIGCSAPNITGLARWLDGGHVVEAERIVCLVTQL